MLRCIRALLLGALAIVLGLAPVGCGKDVKPTTEKPASQDKMQEQMKDRMKEGKERGRGAGGAENGKEKDNGKDKGAQKDKDQEDKP